MVEQQLNSNCYKQGYRKDQWDSAAYIIRVCARTEVTSRSRRSFSTAGTSNQQPAPTLLEIHPFSQLQNKDRRLRLQPSTGSAPLPALTGDQEAWPRRRRSGMTDNSNIY